MEHINYATLQKQNFSTTIPASNTNLLDKNQADEIFTPREIQIIRLICKEYTAKEIAAKTSQSVRTVEGIRCRIMKKLNVKSSVGIAIYAIEVGLFKIQS